MPETVDMEDPCARAQALRAAFWRLSTGSQETEVTYQANGVLRRVRYAQPSMSYLLNELRAAENACALQEGKTPPRQRFSIVGGSRRYYGGGRCR